MEEFDTPEDLIEYISSQAAEEYDDVLDIMVTAHQELKTKKTPEAKSIFNNAISDLHTLLLEYTEDQDLVVETVRHIKDELGLS